MMTYTGVPSGRRYFRRYLAQLDPCFRHSTPTTTTIWQVPTPEQRQHLHAHKTEASLCARSSPRGRLVGVLTARNSHRSVELKLAGHLTRQSVFGVKGVFTHPRSKGKVRTFQTTQTDNKIDLGTQPLATWPGRTEFEIEARHDGPRADMRRRSQNLGKRPSCTLGILGDCGS